MSIIRNRRKRAIVFGPPDGQETLAEPMHGRKVVRGEDADLTDLVLLDERLQRRDVGQALLRAGDRIGGHEIDDHP